MKHTDAHNADTLDQDTRLFCPARWKIKAKKCEKLKVFKCKFHYNLMAWALHCNVLTFPLPVKTTIMVKIMLYTEKENKVLPKIFVSKKTVKNCVEISGSTEDTFGQKWVFYVFCLIKCVKMQSL